jgi:hypothetical protein
MHSIFPRFAPLWPAFSIALGSALLAGASHAAVSISTGATQNMNCGAGVCAPTAKAAVLNAGDIESMLASGNLTVTTTGTGVEAKDIDIKTAVSWSTGSALTIDAHQSITIDQPVSVQGLAALTLTTGNKGALSFGKHGNVTFANLSSSLTINGAGYTLANSIKSLSAAIAANPSGAFAFANSYDANQDGTYTTSPVATVLSGSFEGLGNTISNLTIDDPDDPTVSFIIAADVGSRVSNIGLSNASLTLRKGQSTIGLLLGSSFGAIVGAHVAGSLAALVRNVVAGGLVGTNYGSIASSDAHVAVIVGSRTGFNVGGGGLVGGNSGTIDECFATGPVSASGFNSLAGGLVSENYGTIVNSYATGKSESTNVAGGLIGLNDGVEIATSYSTGKVEGSRYAGGLLGVDDSQVGTISGTYWDTDTSEITNLSQGAGNIPNDPGITGLTTEQLQSGLPQGFDSKIWGESPKVNRGLPYLLANPPR